MRITLDYYRILSVPIQASQEQIDKAYEDRVRQQPRREYSRSAIASREKLLQQAHQVLSNEKERTTYDAKFFAGSNTVGINSTDNSQQLIPLSSQSPLSVIQEESTPPVSPSLEISSDLFPGALLILYELAEYELILGLGMDYLNNAIYFDTPSTSKNFLGKSTNKSPDSLNSSKDDVILSVVLSYLELSREQWRRHEYENAAISGQMGINLLEKEQLCPTLKGEIETDINKLKPYRILELLAQSRINSPERLKGLELLREMLRQRQGIEGKGNDYSGLKLEQFLCFIQQLRHYLTAMEQQELFVNEAKKGSAVAGYLAVYALLARGYARKQPKLILEAQQLLKVLSQTQDLSWEQAIVALLLGQTEKANEEIKKSQEQEKLSLIKQHSQGSPDFLPGLCFYGEKWLQQEVLSQFRDLSDCHVTFKDYFGDPQVQLYLEQLLPAKATVAEKPPTTATTNNKKTNNRQLFSWKKSQKSTGESLATKSSLTLPTTHSETPKATATLDHPNNSHSPVASVSFSVNGTTAAKNSQTGLKNQSTIEPSSTAAKQHKIRVKRKPKVTKNSSSFSLTVVKSGLLLIGLALGLGTLAFVLTSSILKPSTKLVPDSSLSEEQTKPNTTIDTPLVTLPDKTNNPTTENTLTPNSVPETKPAPPAVPVFNETTATEVIQKWLDSKSAAFGPQHQVDQLNNILTDALLSEWRTRALSYKQNNTHRTYKHAIKIRSIVFDQTKPTVSTVEAEVRETAEHYQGGNLNKYQSYDDNLLVRYKLVKQGESWKIEKSEVLQQLE